MWRKVSAKHGMNLEEGNSEGARSQRSVGLASGLRGAACTRGQAEPLMETDGESHRRRGGRSPSWVQPNSHLPLRLKGPCLLRFDKLAWLVSLAPSVRIPVPCAHGPHGLRVAVPGACDFSGSRGSTPHESRSQVQRLCFFFFFKIC